MSRPLLVTLAQRASLSSIMSSFSALVLRVDALYVPAVTTTVANSFSWNAEQQLHISETSPGSRTATCAVSLDASTLAWPAGEERLLGKYNASAFGFSLTPQPTHTLNGGSAGVGSGVIPGTTAVPSPTGARPIVWVRRDSEIAWSWG